MAAPNIPHNPAGSERRRDSRFPLGLPVRIHFAGAPTAVTVELMDLSASGGRLRSATQMARVDQGAAMAFVLPGQRPCLAKGRVVRIGASGEFALRLDKVNEAFLGFVGEFTS